MTDGSGFDSIPTPGRQSMTEQCRHALNRALADQERRWRAGAATTVERYLDNEPALRTNPEAVLDLIYQEILLRTERGEKPQVGEYLERFPHLESELRPLFEVHGALESDTQFSTGVAAAGQTLRPQLHRTLKAPRELADYEILERLGHGGMGVVYKARQKSLGRTVALKMVLSGADAKPEELARFRREAEAVARFAHPNIVQIHEVGEHDGRPFLSLEFVEGGSLHKKLGGLPQPAREAARLVETLARAVHHAHVQGVVHRDLKPANILMTASGVPKITDFGLARFAAGASHTQSGEVLGTPSYMAPEQASGRISAIGPSSDVYALGATLFELLTGRPPFLAANALDTLRQVMELEPVSPASLQPSVPRDLATVCLKCLQKAPSKRYASAEALADDLRRFLDGQPILARQTPAWERTLKWARRRPALAALYAVSAAALMAVLLYNVWLQGALTDANNQRAAAQKAQSAAEEALEQRRRQLVQVLMADGARLLDEGDWFGAMLPLAQAFSLDQKDPARAAIHQVRLATILRQCPRLVQFWPHDGELRHVEFCPSGRQVLTAAGNLARLLEVATGKEVARLSHDQPIRVAALSADGRRVATAADDRVVRIWDAATGRMIGQLTAQEDEILRLAFAGTTTGADNERLTIVTRKPKLSRNEEGKIRIQLWDVAKGSALSPPVDTSAGILFDVALTSDGLRALTVHSLGAGATLTVWAVSDARALFEVRGSPEPTHARFSDDGRLVAVTDVNGAARVWDAASGKQLAVVERVPTVRHLAFSPDNRFLAMGGMDGVARVWRLPAGELAAELKHGPAFTHAVNHVAFSPDGRCHVLIAGADNTVQVCSESASPQDMRRAALSKPETPLLRHSDRLTQASYSPDGRLVLTACADGTVRLWDLAAGRLAVAPLEHDDLVTCAAFDPKGQLAVTGSDDRIARKWDVASGRSEAPPLVHASPVRYAAFSADGRVLTTAEDNARDRGQACVWDPATGRIQFERATMQQVQGVLPHDRAVRRAWFSGDGRLLVTLNQSGACQVWDTLAGQPVTGILEHKSSVTGASFSTDGTRLLTHTFLPDNTVRLWETAGKPLRELYDLVRPDNTATIWELPAGKRLTTIGEPNSAAAFRYASFGGDANRAIVIRDGAAEVCDAASGLVLRSFRKPGTVVTQAALSADGRFLVTANDDRTVQLWDSVTGKTIPTPPQFQHGGQNLPPGQNWMPIFSPDGRLLVLSSAGGVQIWDAGTGEPVSPPFTHPAGVEAVAMSADNRLLLTASDRAARVWSLHPDERDAGDLLLLTQFLGGAHVQPDGRLVSLTSAELATAWEKLRAKFPGDFTTPQQDVIAWHAEAARASERNQQWNAALFHLERLTARAAARPEHYDRKGRAHAELGKWPQAAIDFAKAALLGADRPGPWHRHALLRLRLDDGNGYREACAKILERFGGATDVADALLTVRTCVLAAGADEDVARALAIAERAQAAAPKDPASYLYLGAALHRARRYDDAIVALNRSTKAGSKDDAIPNCLFLAMTHQRLGDGEQAKLYLQRAATAMKQASARLSWSDRLEFALLGREAENLIKEQLP